MEHPHNALDESGDADLDPRIQVTIPSQHKVFRCLPRYNCMFMCECSGISVTNRIYRLYAFQTIHYAYKEWCARWMSQLLKYIIKSASVFIIVGFLSLFSWSYFLCVCCFSYSFFFFNCSLGCSVCTEMNKELLLL
jgi:hypothetical protein